MDIVNKCAALMLVSSFLWAGCGDSSSFSEQTGQRRTSTTPTTRSLTLIHDTVQEAGPASGLDPTVTGMRVGFLDSLGRTVPSELDLTGNVVTEIRAQGPQVGVPPEVTINAPIDAAAVQIDYVDLQGKKVGDAAAPISGDTLKFQGNPVAPVYIASCRDGHFDLIVQDKTFRVKGVGFDYTLGGDSPSSSDTNWFSYLNPDIAKSGANLIRTYGVGWNYSTPQQQAAIISAMLAFAATNSTPEKPIMVLAGLVFDPAQGDMSRWIPETVALVQNDPHYDHLLSWAIGNENPVSEYPQIEAVLKTIKRGMTSDEKVRLVTHPVPVVSAGQVTILQQRLPSIDWLGINTFYGAFDANHKGGGFLNTQAAALATGGWDKPWFISEYYSYDLPSPGFGNVAGMPSQSLNGQPYYLELNSTLNAANYTRSYLDYIVSADALSKGSVGGMALNWGPPHNSKLIGFWKTMYVYRGEFQPYVNPPYSVSGFDRLESAFAVASMYGGSLGLNPPPQIVLPADGDPQGIDCTFKATLDKNPISVAPGAQLTASITATDGDPLSFDWYLVGGSAASISGDINAAQKDPQNFISTTTLALGSGVSQAKSGSTSNTVTFTAPQPSVAGNNYQLRVVVRDGQGGAATASIGFPMQ